MKNPLAYVRTKDGLSLFGLFLEAKNSITVMINIHGTASNFYENDFINELSSSLTERGISVLSTNNRGAAVMQVYPHAGAAIEHFEDCIFDIDAWIEFVLSKGYKNIILTGHSLGTEKVVYYSNKGKHKDKLEAVILFAPADSYGYNYKLLGDKEMSRLLEEAKEIKGNGNGEIFLAARWLCHGGVLPKGADSFINFFGENSELSKAFPIRKGKDLKMYGNIGVPMLVLIGDGKEYTALDLDKSVSLFKSENNRAEVYQIKNCNHDFEGKELEVVRLVGKFISKL